MNETLSIRAAEESDAASIAALAQSLAHYFLASPAMEGTEAFLSSLGQAAIADCIKTPDFNYLAGFIDNALVGVAALREQKHIHHLFVHPDFHRQGIAQKLWLRLKGDAMAAGNPGRFTVNASLYAVPVYSQFGFAPSAEPQTRNGVQFQPMQLAATD
ncbi:MAG TPA: GNAT family N-acetyltransferase [Pseudomonas sp.]|nr:GNAT family N-acetyltransferase [Pseudomonas sp.]